MIKRLGTLILLVVISTASLLVPSVTPRIVPAAAQEPGEIPAAAWSRALGEPFENPSTAGALSYNAIDDGPMQGVPIGGFGVGTIGRTYAGDFARWHLENGVHFYLPLPSAMFSVYTQQGDQTVAQALWPNQPARGLEAWKWDYPVGAGTYYALYPRAWYVYDWDQLPIDLSVEQFSPVIPNEYQVSSYPVALFTWTATNTTDAPVTVGVMFTMQDFADPAATGMVHTVRSVDTPSGKLTGVEMRQAVPFTPEEFNGSMAIAALERPGVTVSTRDHFVTNGDGADIWNDFAADGALDNPAQQSVADNADDLWGAGIAITFTLEPGQTISAPMAFAWDMPVMTFGQGESWYKRYTAFWGRDGDNAWDIAAEGLAQVDAWRDAIVAWQEPILADESRPLWYKTALFNELYILADGGTIWEHGRVGEPDPGPDYFGHFAYLECFDYPYYNTFDVDFYASFALLELWPEIEIGIMRDFAAAIPLDDPQPFVVGYGQNVAVRKVPGAVPHDMGSPYEAPWVRPNAFTWQDTNGWKDLNAKYVLRLYRDAVLLDRPDLVKELWASAVQAMDYLAAMDEDGDGIPENDGIPDQTYDTWVATGVSAYTGGLWVAALAAMHEMAGIVGEDEAAAQYAAQLETARQVYEDKLWNGRYYDYDETSDAIMADQLAGEWYARITGIPTLPDDRVDSALNTIYGNNVMGFNQGQMGAVNGMTPDGAPVAGQQGSEVWTGTTYMLAAHMLLRGLDQQGWATAYGIYKFVYETGGLWFRTPEAWDPSGYFRAGMYMRPLAIWAIETALSQE